jgi:Fe-S cluster assembly protein SufD
LDDEFIEANLSAATLITDQQHADQHTFIDHANPNCVSNENYKGIYDGSSKGVFNGKVLVRVDAQKTNAYQNNANVILSETASVDTKPQLEIFADDVKCSHGCTVGHQDDEALFYMRQRGLSRAQAQGILNLAFTGEITDKLRNETVKTYILNLIEEKLN